MKSKRQLFGTTLKQARMTKKLSQKDIASELGWASPQFISNIERGIVVPPISKARKLSKLLGIKQKDMKSFYKDVYNEKLDHEF
jgi:transcriptional regulator with XRE-family HTH domain